MINTRYCANLDRGPSLFPTCIQREKLGKGPKDENECVNHPLVMIITWHTLTKGNIIIVVEIH